MNSRVVIVGAGGFGRELLGWIQSSPRWRASVDADLVAFVADQQPHEKVGLQFLGSVADYSPIVGDLVLCAIGSPSARRRVVEGLEAKGVTFATFVHDDALLGPGVALGEGTIICPRVVITTGITIGRHVQINVNTAVGHDCEIKDFVTISSSCNLTGGVTIGEGAFLATAASIAPGKKVGANGYVGIGSIVLRSVQPNTTVFGNPATVLNRRPS